MSAIDSENSDTPITVAVNVARQDGPLQIIGLRSPDWQRSVEVALRYGNTSHKATADYWVEPLVTARDRTAPTWNHTNEHAAIRPGYGIIRPGGEVWSQDGTSPVNLTTIMMAVKDLHSTCLQITPVVMEVQFADGSKWSLDKSFSLPSLQTGPPLTCPHSAVSEKDLDQLDRIIVGERSHTGGPSPDLSFFRLTDPVGVTSFSFECRLHRVDEGHVGLRCDR